MEDSIARNIDGIINKIMNHEHIAEDEKWLVALLMSVLWIRGPIMRKQINKMSEDMMKQVNRLQFSHPKIIQWFDKYDKETGSTTSPEMREKIRKMIIEGKYSVKFSNAQHIMMFEKVQNFANLFWGQDWTVYISKSDKKFIASDNPVAVISPKQTGFYGYSFLERTHHFSLTPEIFIVGRYPIKDSGKKLRRKTLFKADEGQVLDFNMIVSGQAYQYAYAQEKQNLEDILNQVKRQEDFFKTRQGKFLRSLTKE